MHVVGDGAADHLLSQLRNAGVPALRQDSKYSKQHGSKGTGQPAYALILNQPAYKPRWRRTNIPLPNAAEYAGKLRAAEELSERSAQTQHSII
jgi:hypothetical protein